MTIRLGGDEYMKIVRAAVRSWRIDHEQRMAYDAEYRERYERRAAEYERIFSAESKKS